MAFFHLFSRKSDSKFTNVCSSVHLSVCKTPQQLEKIILHHSSFIIHHSSIILHHFSSFFIHPFFISRLLSFSACSLSKYYQPVSWLLRWPKYNLCPTFASWNIFWMWLYRVQWPAHQPIVTICKYWSEASLTTAFVCDRIAHMAWSTFLM